jgi:mono/diheme cytochrome c family protein
MARVTLHGILIGLVAAIMVLVTLGGGIGAQRVPAPPPAESTAGADTYAYYCAGCHGREGRGDGPVAGSLATPLPDLSAIAAGNGGVFPRARVRAAVVNTDRPIAAHVTGDMPVWGSIFRIVDPSDARVQVRVDNVVTYLETLQRPMPVTAATGRELFGAHCASCHGANGRGDGPMAGQLRRDVPDLTRFTERNGGIFPSVRVGRIIDGREIPSHGASEMPVWGTTFMRLPGASPADVTSRIDALTRFLESIQQRASD